MATTDSQGPFSANRQVALVVAADQTRESEQGGRIVDGIVIAFVKAEEDQGT